MNLIFADKDVINLIIYGLEGRDYVKVDADHVAYPDGQDANTVPYTAQLGLRHRRQPVHPVRDGRHRYG